MPLRFDRYVELCITRMSTELSLDHAYITVFIRIGNKQGRVSNTDPCVIQNIGFPVMHRMNHLSELEEYGQTGMNGTIQRIDPAIPRILSILENRNVVSNAALKSSKISITIHC